MSSETKKDWEFLEIDKIPHFVVMDFLHPNHGTIRGFLITTSGYLGDRRIESVWVHPVDHSADICAEEFTHYRKIMSDKKDIYNLDDMNTKEDSGLILSMSQFAVQSGYKSPNEVPKEEWLAFIRSYYIHLSHEFDKKTESNKGAITLGINDLPDGVYFSITGDNDFIKNDIIGKPKNQVRFIKQMAKELKISEYDN